MLLLVLSTFPREAKVRDDPDDFGLSHVFWDCQDSPDFPSNGLYGNSQITWKLLRNPTLQQISNDSQTLSPIRSYHNWALFKHKSCDFFPKYYSYSCEVSTGTVGEWGWVHAACFSEQSSEHPGFHGASWIFPALQSGTVFSSLAETASRPRPRPLITCCAHGPLGGYFLCMVLINFHTNPAK